jgi:hypothetical protein
MKLGAMLAAAALLSAGGAAFAENGTREEQAACRADVRRLCGHIRRGDNQKYRDCLQSHFFELSQKCQQVLMKHQNRQ